MSRIAYRPAVHSHLLFWGALAVLVAAEPAAAQSATYSIDPARSLAWWQIDPHFGHLWATTCPNDRSWQPGEGHSGRYNINYKSRPKYRTTKESESRIPLFPRDTVRANCRRAVSGSFTTADVRGFASLKGTVAVIADSIVNGSDVRDNFAYRYIYKTAKYPAIDFVIDSVTSVALVGDTVNAIAVGTFSFRGVDKRTRVQVQGIREGSTMRVRGMFAMPATELRERYSLPPIALGLGLGMKLWDTLFMGFDLILTEQAGPAGGS
jgi:polyisoprenoid-binding protein YceI